MLAVQIDTPICTVEEFARRSGIPEKTIRNKIYKGELPIVKTNLYETKAGAVYVNLVALFGRCLTLSDDIRSPPNPALGGEPARRRGRER